MKPESRQKIQNRLSRIAGQVSGLQKMVDEDRYCVDILTQIAAVRSAIDALGRELLTGHVETCIARHGCDDAHPDARVQSTDQLLHELSLALSRFLK
jgi:DNA-binding FrmR family transcriptional regulator